MKLTFERQTLRLRYSFKTAHRATTERETLQVAFEHDGVIGVGEAAPNPRYGETPDSASQALQRFAELLGEIDTDPLAFDPFLRSLFAHVEGEYAAKAGLDIAVMNWAAQKLDAPLYRLWGLDPASIPPTNMTIGMDTPDVMAQHAREAADYPFLKVKLGGEDDRAMIRAIRQAAPQPIRIDANEGWRDREQAISDIEWLAENGVELIEQPMPAEHLDDAAWLKERSPLPLIADEAFTGPADLFHLRDGYHGVNVKLMKTGGTLVARQAIATAKAAGMSIMLGCMVESEVPITAAANLAPLVDYVDLDGYLLLENRTGPPVIDGRIQI